METPQSSSSSGGPSTSNGATINPPPPTPSTSENKDKRNNDSDSDKEKGDEGMFECNICLDTAKDAVVSHCGHLFCWPCLHQWLETRPTRQSCPVCKAAISRDKVIPLYGRGGSNVDPRFEQIILLIMLLILMPCLMDGWKISYVSLLIFLII